MKRLLTFIFVTLSLCGFAQEKKRLYLANDTHTDWMYNGDYDQWKDNILKMTDFYLNLGEQTINEPVQRQSKWNYDSAIWLWMIEKYKDKAYLNRVIDQLKRQQASVPYNFILPAFGGTPAEAVIRGMYYGGYLERKYGIDVDMAVAQENATIPLGLASLWAGSGVKYSWKGVCNCATKIKNVGCRKHEIYYYKGLDNQKVLMKWYSNFGWNAELGGYAEILEPSIAVMQMDTLCGSKRYPYNIAGAFGKGWDNIQNYSFDMQWGLNRRTLPGTQLFLSNELDFFKDFEGTYGTKLPTETLAFGNEWDTYFISLAEPAIRIKRALNKLRVAEAMAAVVQSYNPKAFDELEEAKKDFYFAISTYWIHSWTADGPVSKKTLANWAKGEATKIEKYVNLLYDKSKALLSNSFNKEDNKERLFVFNASNWLRSDFTDLKYSGQKDVVCIDLSTQKSIKHQFVEKNKETFLRIMVENIPSVGYKIIEIIPKSQKSEISKIQFKNGSFENSFYKLKITKSGVITSLYDKKRKKEWVRNIESKFFNDLGAGDKDTEGEIKIENHGPVSTTIVCSSNLPLKHQSRITLYENIERIDIDNVILENFSDKQHFTFSCDLENPEVWHEEVGAVINAKLAPEGGHYSEYMARYDYLSLGHMMHVGNSKEGLSISNLGAYFMKLGKSTPTKLDATSSQIHILVGGQIDQENNNMGIPAQGGDSVFHVSFSIQPHVGSFNQTAAMRFALEHQTPFAAQRLREKGNLSEYSFSFLKNNNSNNLLWSLKPAESDISGNKLTARFWNMSNNDFQDQIEFNRDLLSASVATHVETEISNIKTEKSKLNFDTQKQQMKTVIIELK
jgi:alpha-mannosidase